MKIGFNKDGLTLNSKKFDPLNFSINGHGLESDMSRSSSHSQTDPFEVLESLSSLKGEEVSKLDKIKTLQSIVKY